MDQLHKDVEKLWQVEPSLRDKTHKPAQPLHIVSVPAGAENSAPLLHMTIPDGAEKPAQLLHIASIATSAEKPAQFLHVVSVPLYQKSWLGLCMYLLVQMAQCFS